MNQKIKISADGGGTAKILRAFQGEHNARTYQIEIDGPDGQQIDLSGTTATFYISEEDKILQLPMTISENLASVTLTYEACRFSGDLKCWIQIVKPEVYDLRVDNLVLRVFPCKIDKSIPDDGEVSVLYQLISDTKKAIQKANQAADKATEYTTVFQNSGYHNSIYRGKDISANEADGSMYTNIANGTFDDIFVGDYFHKTVNGQNYVFQVLGCDIKMNRGSTPLTAHHIVVMPTTSFGSYKMNDTNTTDGGYVGSKMYTDVLPVWAGYLSNAFGSHLITSKELLVNATSSGSPSGWSWFDSTVNLMTVEEILGHGTFGISHYEYYFNIGISYGQLPLFRLSPDKICIRYATYWLRNIPQSTFFSTVNNEGYVHITPASASAELRPYFLLG